MTAEQYLEIERRSEFRSEFLNGQVFAMSCATMNHARIVRNVLSRLSAQLRGTSYEAFANDLRLFCARDGIFAYPDIVIACGAGRFLDIRRDTITDATAVVEVLSPGTMNYDRGEKFRYYRSLESFSEYLLLAQDTPRAEHHVRQADGSWIFREFISPTSVIELTSIGCRLDFESAYETVEFD